MPWTKFYATRTDLTDVLAHATGALGCLLIEDWPALHDPPRRYSEPAALLAVSLLGEAPTTHVGVWAPGFGPDPVLERGVLRGAAMLSLQCGGRANGVLSASSLGWWSERGARAALVPSPDLDSVAWSEVSGAGERLRRYLKRHARGTASGHLVLPGAWQHVEGGGRLLDPDAPQLTPFLAAL